MTANGHSTSEEARAWANASMSFSGIFGDLKHRVHECLDGSESMREIDDLAEGLYVTMENAQVKGGKRNWKGEQGRVLSCSKALGAALEAMDTDLAHAAWLARQTGPIPEDKKAPKIENPEASHIVEVEKEKHEVSCAACLESMCLLLSALYEKAQFSSGEVNKAIWRDFSILKRSCRDDQLQTLRGNTSTVSELFAAVKDLDKQGKMGNLTATLLTSDGPVGRLNLQLRTFVALSVLHTRLLRELFLGKFAFNCPRGMEPMTSEDPMDFYDFEEALVRNTPAAYCKKKGMLYAWMYAPEVMASPQGWQDMFGEGENNLPTLFDGVSTPAACLVSDKDSSSGFSMNIEEAMKQDYAGTLAQAPVGFPWSDDLLGAYLRIRKKAEEAKEAKKPSPPQSPVEESVSESDEEEKEQHAGKDEEAKTVKAMELGSKNGQAREVMAKIGMNEHVKAEVLNEKDAADGMAVDEVEVGAGVGEVKVENDREAAGTGEGIDDSVQVAMEVAEEDGSTPAVLLIVQPSCSGGAAKSHGVQQQLTNGKAGTRVSTRSKASSVKAAGAGMTAGKAVAPVKEVKKKKRKWLFSSPRTRKKHESKQEVPKPKKVTLPLGIFLVSIICSGSFTNTQIHVEDLLLMSININVFGSPKVWWWIPQDKMEGFKAVAERMTRGGRSDLYTKCVAPFAVDKDVCPPKQQLPLATLVKLGAKRALQMPGMGVLTGPGYAFHFTVSTGFNIAESCNMFLDVSGGSQSHHASIVCPMVILIFPIFSSSTGFNVAESGNMCFEVLGWDVSKLMNATPPEQYPDPTNSMSAWMEESGILKELGVKIERK
eukprot:gene3125-13137_t